MKTSITFILFLVFLSSCQKTKETPKEEGITSSDTFQSELNTLKEYFQIPGLAILVKEGNTPIFEEYLGTSNIDANIPLDQETTIPMASLTKILSGIVVMQLKEEGKLSLDDAISDYVPSMGVPDSIKIKHVFSHTSQGKVGKHFYYSNRFGLLTPVIEKADGQSFKEAIQKRIIDTLQLTHTYLLKDTTQIATEKRKIVAPYFLGGAMVDGFLEKKVTDGFIDYGFSASAGITSTVQDLGILSDALDNNLLISEASKQKMMTPFTKNSPYGLGMFTQQFLGETMVWGYGQYDCYSSLFLKVPSKNLTFIIAANNNLMSDPARLINGDVTTSLFAMSFLKNYVFNFHEMPLFENNERIPLLKNELTPSNKEFYAKKLIAQASAETYMARFDAENEKRSKAILKAYFNLFPDYQSNADLTVLFNLQFLKSIAVMREQPAFTAFDNEYKQIGNTLLKEDPNNPYANYYMANYYQTKNDIDSTRFYFQRIITAENFSPWWYTNEAKQWLKNQPKNP